MSQYFSLNVFMFRVFAICTLAFLCACFSCMDRSHYNIDDIEVPVVSSSVLDDNRIFGNWALCSMVTKGSSIQMNVCPVVVFKEAGEGLVRMSGLIEGFRWRLTGNRLSIKPSSNENESLFSDSVYSTMFKYEKGSYSLVLSAVTTDETFYMSR
ncbi:MAG: hypothetical protein WBP58_14515 [Chitinophagaceae bacterium]